MDDVHSRRLCAELVARGLVPDKCTFLSLDISSEGMATIKLEKFVTSAEMQKLGEALVAAATP